MCAKEPYPTEQSARKAAKGMSRENKLGMRHYYCVLCECWHVATKRGRKKLKRNNNKYPFRYQAKKKK